MRCLHWFLYANCPNFCRNCEFLTYVSRYSRMDQAKFLKAVFHKFYLVHSWTLRPIFSYQEIRWNVDILRSAGVGEYGCYNSSKTPLSGTQRTLNCQRHHPCNNESLIPPEENSLPHSYLFFLSFEFYLPNLRKTWTFWMTLPNCR